MTVPDLPMTRLQARELVLAARRRLGLSWAQLAAVLGQDPVWATSALMGQQPLSDEQARSVGDALELPPAAVTALAGPPDRSAQAVDLTDPVLYRLAEAVQVYGPAVAELIREEFGDGIMSAIDFQLDFARKADPAGDRVVLTFDGKFLPYRRW